MRKMFDENSQIGLIDFYGKNLSKGEMFPSLEKNGLLYGFISKFVKVGMFEPVLKSWDIRDGSVSFSVTHKGVLLRYGSSCTFRGQGYEFENFYNEGLCASGNFGQKELEKRVNNLSFLKSDFQKLVEANPERVAPTEVVKLIHKVRENQNEAMELRDLLG